MRSTTDAPAPVPRQRRSPALPAPRAVSAPGVQCCGERPCGPGGCAHEGPDTAATVQRALDEPGVPLDGATRGDMQRYLGHSFAEVRVHTGPRAAASARALGASAYTTGRDVVFGEGRYRPATATGVQLLAHELTHVVQQRAATGSLAGGSAVDADHAAEQEARRVGAAAPTAVATPEVPGAGEHGPRSGPRQAVAPVVQRQVAPTVQRQAAGDATGMSITPAYAAGLSDDELVRQARLVHVQLSALPPAAPAYSSVYENLVILLREGRRRPSLQPGAGRPGMLPRLREWHAAGLLDPPFRPADVPAFPPFPVMPEQATEVGPPAPLAVGLLAPLPEPPSVAPGAPGAPGALTTGEVATAEVTTAEVTTAEVTTAEATTAEVTTAEVTTAEVTTVEGGALVEGGGAAVGAGVLAFLVVMLWSSPTAPAWLDEINTTTGEPYGSPQEYQWVRRLSPEQEQYLRRLSQARREVPDPALEEDPAPWETPTPEPRTPEEEDRRRGCVARQIKRRGGHARHDAYATKVTGRTTDYYVQTPALVGIAYDGQGLGGADVWEVKVGFGWFFNPQMAGLRDVVLRRFDAQKSLGVLVAGACGYAHLWSIPDRWVAQLLTARWGGVPPVLSVPE